MTGAVLGTLQLGATPLATVAVAIVFNPVWAAHVNAVVQVTRTDQ